MMNETHNGWQIIEDGFNKANTLTNETLLAQGNGYFGWRGNLEEGLPGYTTDGNYINGFYESAPIIYGEKFIGYPEQKQTMLNVANGKVIELTIAGEPLNLLQGTLISHRRVLDMQTAVLHRETIWESTQGHQIHLNSQRLILHQHPHLALIRYQVTPLNFTAPIALFSGLDGAVTMGAGGEHDPRLGTGFIGEVWQTETAVSTPTTALLSQRTRQTQLTAACGVHHTVDVEAVATPVHNGLRLGTTFTINAQKGQSITLTKFIAYQSSLDSDDLATTVPQLLTQAAAIGFDAFVQEQRAYLDTFWANTDVIIEGDDELQLGIRFNMFHLLQSTGRSGHNNVAAKGLTGEGYEGHYFWDTESYILPFFLYNNPHISRQLLLFRYHTLEQARAHAREMAHKKGALYPWRTINGHECSPFYPAGTAQYHINADIAFALWRYYDATQDHAFMKAYGIEMLWETARLWLEVGHFSATHNGRFCINGVTGPDEYTTLVNNNAYTNLMAQANLHFAAAMATWLQESDTAVYQALTAKLNLDPTEPVQWQAAADNMFIPYDETSGVIPQDDSFLQKEVWDFANTPKSHYPLLLHYHPLVISRYQVCKQADLLLAHFLRHDVYDRAQKQRDYDYYEPLTTHDSSLSTCIFSILAAELGDKAKAYRYFAETALTDLHNKKGNTKDGIHAASMAGAWQAILFGFAGMRAKDGLSFRPLLPDQWQAYAFKVTYRGSLLAVRVTADGTAFTLLNGDSLTLSCYEQTITLTTTASQHVAKPNSFTHTPRVSN